jgi:probable HAF family extracellular repeat protein
VYSVRKGDTLSGIAKRFAVTLRNLLAANPQIPPAYLPTLGGSGTSPLDINSRGQIVGWSETAAGAGHAVLVDEGRITDLGTLGGTWSAAVAINDLGQIVGWSDTASDEEHAFIWQEGVMTDVGTLGGNGTSQGGDINNRGQIVSGSRFIWQDGVITDLGGLGGNGSEAVAINDLGRVVGSSHTASGRLHAFLWQDGVMTDLGTLGGTWSSASAINDLGQVLGESNGHAFLWQDGVMTDLGPLGQGRGCG